MNEIWQEVPGQDRVIHFLTSAAREPRDAYLFCGPKGVGKALAARAFAAAILCSNQCGECNTCSRVLRALHPDVQIFQPEGYTYPLELIREVVASAGQTPLEGARRAFIIEEADRIVERSQNALLKALEEPGGSITWILVADTLDPFLPTVLSRCTVVEFTAIPEETSTQMLSARFGMSSEEARRIVRVTRGDLEQSMSLASGRETAGIRALAFEAILSARRDPEAAFETLARLQDLVGHARDALTQRQSGELEAFQEYAGAGRGVASARKRILDRHKREIRRAETDAFIEFLQWLAAAARDLAAAASGGGADSVTNHDEADRIFAAAGDDSKSWLDLVDDCLAATRAVNENASPSLQVEALLLRLAGVPLLQS